MPTNDEVIAKVTSSFKRICMGGIKRRTILGCKCHISLQKFHDDDASACRSENKHNEWLAHLESLASKSVSYPNGPLVTRTSSDNEGELFDSIYGKMNQSLADVDEVNIGKPHDVETKLALSFFHRYKHKCKRQTGRIISDEDQDQDENINKYPPLEIISETGLTRAIESPMELAKLLVTEMEDLIWHERNDTNVDAADPDHTGGCNSHNTPSHSHRTTCTYTHTRATSTYSIKIDHSGIICIVTPRRVEYLRSIGRLPCSHCIKWVRGEKGLWWHTQKEHVLDHSDAKSIASSSTGINEFSIVIYRDTSKRRQTQHMNIDDDDKHNDNFNNNSKVIQSATRRAQSRRVGNPIEQKAAHYFQIVKDGNLKLFISFLESNDIVEVSTSTIDKNGASALHWASGCGHLHIVKHLIEEHNCPPDEKQKGKRSFRNRTPLHWASRNGHLSIVKYLVEQCDVNIDAVTIDGTTAFCWSCWQGHKEIMSYLYSKGADTAAANTFGCNAILWSAQSTTSGLEGIRWLKSIGLNIGLINSNGHGILHKSAQRGKEDVCRWIFGVKTDSCPTGTSMNVQNGDTVIDLLRQISPDAEGCCPSDLAGMEGFITLANWLVVKEQEVGLAVYTMSSKNDIPLWLKDGMKNSRHKTNVFGLDEVFEREAGIKKICAYISQASRKRSIVDVQ